MGHTYTSTGVKYVSIKMHVFEKKEIKILTTVLFIKGSLTHEHTSWEVFKETRSCITLNDLLKSCI